jgi:hypothetical protein
MYVGTGDNGEVTINAVSSGVAIGYGGGGSAEYLAR